MILSSLFRLAYISAVIISLYSYQFEINCANASAIPDIVAASNAIPHSSRQGLNTNVTVVGLGSMGIAVVECLASTMGADGSSTIHAWNRGEMKRQKLQDLGLSNVVVHEKIVDAIESSNVILTMIDDWVGTTKLIGDLGDKLNTSSKTFVLFSTYSPHDIKRLQRSITTSSNGKFQILGGVIVGVPQTICTPNTFLFSSGSIITDEVSSSVKPVLDHLGTHYNFYNQDIGLAPLTNIALIQGITFGIAGHELTQLLFQKYEGTNKHFIEIYNNKIAKDVIPEYVSMLIPLISNGVQYVPASTFTNVMKLHMTFCIEIGIVSDTYLQGYVNYLEKIENPSKIGPANWIYYAFETGITQSTESMNDKNSDKGPTAEEL